MNKKIILNGISFDLTLWDTAGEEKYHALAPIFYRGADGAIIIYDCTRKETFERAEKWFQELKDFSEGNPRIILVGNKIDLTNKEVNPEDAKNLAEKYSANFLEVSALTGKNIESIFDTITIDIYNYNNQSQKKIDEKKFIDKTFENEKRTRAASKRKIVIVNERFERREDSSGGCC